MNAFCFNYQHVYCLYSLVTNRLSLEIVVKCGQLLDNVQRAIQFNHQNRGVNKKPSFAKKGFWWDKDQKQLLSFLRKTK